MNGWVQLDRQLVVAQNVCEKGESELRGSYLAALHAVWRRNWPKGAPLEPVYPLAEIPLTEYQGFFPALPDAPFRKLVIADPGDIADCIARAAADLGIASVAIHSEDDAASLHLRERTARVRFRALDVTDERRSQEGADQMR